LPKSNWASCWANGDTRSKNGYRKHKKSLKKCSFTEVGKTYRYVSERSCENISGIPLPISLWLRSLPIEQEENFLISVCCWCCHRLQKDLPLKREREREKKIILTKQLGL
jgi:hypothetical protein